MVVGGRRTKLQVAQFKLCFSRAFMLRAYPLQTHEMLYDAHNHALAALGGVLQPCGGMGERADRESEISTPRQFSISPNYTG